MISFRKWGLAMCLLFISLAAALYLNVPQAEALTPKVADFFGGEGVEIRTNVTTPGYVRESRNGVHVRSTASGVLTYENIIDLSDNTKDDLLIELQITPDKGIQELNQFIIELRDVDDPKNYLLISIYDYPYFDSSKGKLAVVTVKSPTISSFKSIWYRTLDGKISPYVDSLVGRGTAVWGSFEGSKGDVSDSIKVYYDNNEKAIYTTNAPDYEGKLKAGGYIDDNGKILVLDLDDPAHMGYMKTNLWTGLEHRKG